MSAAPLERYYSTDDVANIVGICAETVRRAAARGELRSIRVGHRRRYAESAVREWLDSLASPSNERSSRASRSAEHAPTLFGSLRSRGERFERARTRRGSN
ncbi:MAG: helix-turn-helix domain-containing protein [Gaiellaceae bacterium]